MVNITNEIYTKLKTELKDDKVNVFLDYPNAKPEFPCVILTEISHLPHTETIDSNGTNYYECSLQVDIFSDKANARTIVNGIRIRVDDILSEQYKMTKESDEHIVNYMDTEVYRHMMRYRFIISKNKTIYRN